MNPPLTNMGPAWPTMPHLQPAQTKLARLCCGPTFGVFDADGRCVTCRRWLGEEDPTTHQGGAIDNRSIPHNVEPPIAAHDKVRRKLRDLKIEERELEELLATNRALQLQYEAQILPF